MCRFPAAVPCSTEHSPATLKPGSRLLRLVSGFGKPRMPSDNAGHNESRSRATPLVIDHPARSILEAAGKKGKQRRAARQGVTLAVIVTTRWPTATIPFTPDPWGTQSIPTPLARSDRGVKRSGCKGQLIEPRPVNRRGRSTCAGPRCRNEMSDFSNWRRGRAQHSLHPFWGPASGGPSSSAFATSAPVKNVRRRRRTLQVW